VSALEGNMLLILNIIISLRQHQLHVVEDMWFQVAVSRQRGGQGTCLREVGKENT